MNESTLTQLKILVERVVRPVRASIAPKLKMRQELLAHVIDVFEEEVRLGDEQAALARTQERFGKSAELTGELQASVPRVDRIHQFAENLFGRGESALRLAASVAALLGTLCLIPYVIVIFSHREPVGRVLLVPLWIAFMSFCGTLVTVAMRQALLGPAGPSWLRVGGIAVAAWLITPVTAFAIGLTVMPDIQKILSVIVPLLPYGVVAPLAMVALVYLFDSQYRQDREWARLDIS
jgi:hypothetical protein